MLGLSSLSVLLGGLGFSGYAAANAHMESTSPTGTSGRRRSGRRCASTVGSLAGLRLGQPLRSPSRGVRSRFGHLDVSPGGRVRAFDEEPLLASPVNIGCIVVSVSARSRLSAASGQLEKGLLPRLAAEGELSAYLLEGRFEPMDTVADQRVARNLRL